MPELLAPDDVRTTPDEVAEKWHPTEPGEALVGRLESVAERDVSWGTCDVAFVRARAGKLWSVFLSRAVLVGKFQEKEPRCGQRIAVIYDGTRKSQEGYPYHVYELRVAEEKAPSVSAAEREEPAQQKEKETAF